MVEASQTLADPSSVLIYLSEAHSYYHKVLLRFSEVISLGSEIFSYLANCALQAQRY